MFIIEVPCYKYIVAFWEQNKRNIVTTSMLTCLTLLVYICYVVLLIFGVTNIRNVSNECNPTFVNENAARIITCQIVQPCMTVEDIHCQ